MSATPAHPAANHATINLVASGDRLVYFEKNRVFKAGHLALNKLAWNNDKGLRFYFRWLPRTEVMIDRDSWGRQYSGARGEILRPPED